MELIWLGAGIAVLAVAFALAVRQDLLADKKRRERKRVAREIVFGSLKREAEPPPPLDFSEALRRRRRS